MTFTKCQYADLPEFSRISVTHLNRTLISALTAADILDG